MASFTRRTCTLMLGAFHILSSLKQGVQAQLQKREPDPDWTTDPAQFFRRSWHSTVLLGDYIYIDGGEVFREENGTVRVLPYNSTYSLPISASWDPATVSLKLVDKGDAPVYNRPSLWPATDNQSFFSFNGDISYALDYEITGYDPPASAQLWHFEPDGSGGGTWKLLSVAPSTVTQSVGGALAVAKDSAYMLGGIENWRTSYKLYGDGEYIDTSFSSADGILSYNMDNQTWENRTMTPFVPNGWFVEGQLQHLTGFANDSLLLAMGGDTALPLGFYTGQTAIPYDTVTIHNTETKEWRNQTTTGDIPNGHIGGSCWVGVPGDNGTYEIFIHGGAVGAASDVQSQVNIDLDRVSVLSIPSFSWHQTSYTPTDARCLHTCHVVGNRQMLAIGGMPPNLGAEYFDKDAWPQGLGIFDLTEMQWKSTYDADAAPYKTPKQIKDHIAANGTYPSSWNDDVIERWITGRVSTTQPNSTSPSSPGSSGSGSGGGGGGGSNTGAIAGGVVGGVGGALLIGLLAWFLLRRRNKKRKDAERREQDAEKKDRQGFDKPELEGKEGIAPNKPWLESGDNYDSSELQGKPRHEMEALRAGHELPAAQKPRYELESHQ